MHVKENFLRMQYVIRRVYIELIAKRDQPKGDKMYYTDLVEIEDSNLSTYLNHYDEYDEEHVSYNDIYECIDTITNCIEEYEW